MRFDELDPDSDYALYQRLAEKNMAPGDLFSGERIRRFICERRARAWWFFDEQSQRVGWCAVLTRATWTDGVHLLGNFVLPAFRGQGYGQASVAWRVSLFGVGEMTAAVTPGNLASERALTANGFSAGEMVEGRWLLWRRPASSPTAGLTSDNSDNK